MNRCIEIHDSRLSAITQDADGVKLHFANAYIHASEGRPARDAGTGWSQELEIVVKDGWIEGKTPMLPCDLTDGTLILGDETLRNIVPMPCEFSGRVDVTLEGNWNTTFRIVGDGLRIVELGKARYVEEFKFTRESI